MDMKKLWNNEKGTAGAVMLLVGIALGLLVLAVVFAIGPLVGYNVESAVTIPTTGTGSMWNSVTNTAITNGSELWQQNTPMIAVAALVAIAGVIIAVLMMTMGGRKGGL